MDKLLSVVVVTYRQFDYLNRLLDTIMAQTYSSIEIIISDDGSPAFDEQAIASYIEEHKGSNIIGYKLLHSDSNVGTVKNLNRGIKTANGEYIKVIAGDDLYPNETVFEKQVRLLEKESYPLVIGYVCDCRADETIINNPALEKGNQLLETVLSLPKEERLKFCLKNRITPYSTQAFCYTKEFFDKYGLFDERFVLMEDSEMPDRIVREDVKIGIVPEIVVLHRADVGVSGNSVVINPRSLKYYEDTKLWFKILTDREKDSKWRAIYRNHYKMACYRIDMINAKGSAKRLLCSIRYIPSLIFYALRNPQIATKRFKGLLASSKLMK